ncbi:hypothetical protein BH09MYX1_BH09MYX1_05600 [soil metagenome]
MQLLDPMIPSIDQARAPLLLVRFPSEITAEEAETHFREIADIAAKGRIAVVVDLTNVRFFSGSERKLGARAMRDCYERARGNIGGVAHVIQSRGIRAMMIAIHWLSPPPFPCFVTNDEAKAFAWARAQL